MNLMRAMPMMAVAAVLSGCSVLNTGESQFACEEHGDCPTPIEVYSDTHTSPREVEMGRTPDEWKSGGRSSDGEKKTSEKQLLLARSLELTRLTPSSLARSDTGEMVKPIREPSQVMRVWIAPWIDQGDNLNWSGYVFTEISPRRWNFGEQEVRHFGLPVQVAPDWSGASH